MNGKFLVVNQFLTVIYSSVWFLKVLFGSTQLFPVLKVFHEIKNASMPAMEFWAPKPNSPFFSPHSPIS